MSDLYPPDALISYGKQINCIDEITDQLAFERVVYLPFDLAVLYSAAQNFRLDLAKGFHASAADWKLVQISYYEEVYELMRTDGCNLYPGENAELWIHCKTLGSFPMPTGRALTLNGIFDTLFSHPDTTLLTGEFYPNPRTCNNDLRVTEASQKLARKLHFH